MDWRKRLWRLGTSSSNQIKRLCCSPSCSCRVEKNASWQLMSRGTYPSEKINEHCKWTIKQHLIPFHLSETNKLISVNFKRLWFPEECRRVSSWGLEKKHHYKEKKHKDGTAPNGCYECNTINVIHTSFFHCLPVDVKLSASPLLLVGDNVHCLVLSLLGILGIV